MYCILYIESTSRAYSENSGAFSNESWPLEEEIMTNRIQGFEDDPLEILTYCSFSPGYIFPPSIRWIVTYSSIGMGSEHDWSSGVLALKYSRPLLIPCWNVGFLFEKGEFPATIDEP